MIEIYFLFSHLFIVFSNLILLKTIFYCNKKKRIIYTNLYISTMIASSIYHFMNAFIPTKNYMVGYIDALFSYCCIYSIFLLFLIKKNLELYLFFVILFCEMYMSFIIKTTFIHLIIILTINFLFLIYLYFLYKYNIIIISLDYKLKFILLGILLNIIEFFCYFIFPKYYLYYDEIWHGLHHIFGYMSLYCYNYAITKNNICR